MIWGVGYLLCISIFSTTIISNFPQPKNDSATSYHKSVCIFISACYFCPVLTELQFSWQILVKVSPAGAELFCADTHAHVQLCKLA